MNPHTQLTVGTIASLLLAFTAHRLRLLTASGALAAAFVGAVAFGLGGVSGAVPLLTFFVTANALGRWRRARKAALGFEKGGRRDASQVLANGGVAVVALLAGAIWHSLHAAGYLAFAACLAEANADTWATEIGSGVDTQPRHITTGKPCAPGQSGGVSLPGTFAAAAGASLIAAVLLPWITGPSAFIVAVSGFCGAMIDSALGATVQAQHTDREGRITEKSGEGTVLKSGFAGVGNDAVNLMGTLSAGLLAMLARHLLHR